MKDYSLSKDEKSKFIKYYNVYNGYINIYLADHNHYVVPYTKENEIRILNIMKSQISNNMEKTKALCKKRQANLKKYIKLLIAAFIIVGGAVTIVNGINAALYNVLLLSFGTLTTCGVLSVTTRYFKLNSLKKDIEKNEYFNNNEEKINEFLPNNNSLLNVSKKTIQQIREKEIKSLDKDPLLTINDIEFLSLNDLRTIKKNLERNNYFNLDENSNINILKKQVK